MTFRTDFIAQGRNNRPGRACSCTHITIHETDNTAAGANAAAHARYVKGDAAAALPVSWHYSVDDRGAVQHLPDREVAYHAGDARGNACSIGIELCVNRDGDFAATAANAATLTRVLMQRHGIPASRVVQHHHWNKKDCPRRLRRVGWQLFLKKLSGDEEDEMRRYQTREELPDWGLPTVERLLRSGALRGSDRGLDLSEDMLRTLVILDRAGLFGAH